MTEVTVLSLFYPLAAPPPPPEVQGLCSNIVWYTPDLSCEGIYGYDVRLYHPKAVHQNVTRRVGSNGTFYIIKDEDGLAGRSGETHVQVYPLVFAWQLLSALSNIIFDKGSSYPQQWSG